MVTRYYEYIPHDLEKEIKLRQNQKERFSGNDLFFILRKMIVACAFLQSRGLHNGDVTPRNILITCRGNPKLMEEFQGGPGLPCNYFFCF